MNRVTIDDVNGLDEERRRHLEAVVGAPLEHDAQVVIVVYNPAKVPSEDTRRAAVSNLRRLFAEADAHADRLGISDEGIDAAIEEAFSKFEAVGPANAHRARHKHSRASCAEAAINSGTGTRAF